MDQDATCTEVGIGIARPHCARSLDRDRAPVPEKGRTAAPNFRPMSIVAKRLDINMPLSIGWPRPRPRCDSCVRDGTRGVATGGISVYIPSQNQSLPENYFVH